MTDKAPSTPRVAYVVVESVGGCLIPLGWRRWWVPGVGVVCPDADRAEAVRLYRAAMKGDTP